MQLVPHKILVSATTKPSSDNDFVVKNCFRFGASLPPTQSNPARYHKAFLALCDRAGIPDLKKCNFCLIL